MRRAAHLTLDNLADLPDGCHSCVFWELDPVRRERAMQQGHAADEKEAWLSRVLLEWGSCGRVVHVDDNPAGFIIYAPPAFVPGAGSFPTSPVSEDAVLLVTGAVYPEYVGGGLGRVLLQAAAKDLLERGGIRAIEAFGSTRRTTPERSSGCVLPAEFLRRVGFKTQRSHPRYPRMRLELKSVLTWREEVEGALERLLGAMLSPRPVQPMTERSGGTTRPATRPSRGTRAGR